jgi:plasmid maintenance system antidote protein VapI
MSRPKKVPPIHPGEILLEEFLKPLGMSNEQARRPAPRSRESDHADRGRPAQHHGETALTLARYFGTSPEFWLGLQKDYDLQVARDEFEAEVERQVQPRGNAA